MKHSLTLTAALLVALGASGTVSAQSNAATHNQATHANKAADTTDHPDAWVLTKVKAQFATSDIVDATDINVDVTDGRVVLKGPVANAAERREAVRLAKSTEGVKSVDDSGLTMTTGTEPEEEARKARMERQNKAKN